LSTILLTKQTTAFPKIDFPFPIEIGWEGVGTYLLQRKTSFHAQNAHSPDNKLSSFNVLNLLGVIKIDIQLSVCQATKLLVAQSL